MLESHPDYEVVGEAPNGRIAVEMARELFGLDRDFRWSDVSEFPSTIQPYQHLLKRVEPAKVAAIVEEFKEDMKPMSTTAAPAEQPAHIFAWVASVALRKKRAPRCGWRRAWACRGCCSSATTSWVEPCALACDADARAQEPGRRLGAVGVRAAELIGLAFRKS